MQQVLYGTASSIRIKTLVLKILVIIGAGIQYRLVGCLVYLLNLSDILLIRDRLFLRPLWWVVVYVSSLRLKRMGRRLLLLISVVALSVLLILGIA